MRKQMTPFLADRIVEAFAGGLSMTDLAYRFQISLVRIEATIRRHAKRHTKRRRA